MASLTLSHCTFQARPLNPKPKPNPNSSLSKRPSLRSSKCKPETITITTTTIPARDRVIDFGKYKGRMLGTLPSTYLKWVSSNLRARDFAHWANLADQVLLDLVYRDRLEWELAEKVLKGEHEGGSILRLGGTTAAYLIEISKRFGWDNEDKVGWSNIDFELLGTSKGGRIPRLDKSKNMAVTKEGEMTEISSRDKNKAGCMDEGEKRRGERRERMRSKRRMSASNKLNTRDTQYKADGSVSNAKSKVVEKEDQNMQTYNPFPGRQALIRKVIERKSI